MIVLRTYGISFTSSVYQVQTAILALAEASVLRPSMRQGVAEISRACVALEGKDCAPASACKVPS